MIKIVYTPESDNEVAAELRRILCRECTVKNRNPLTETKFNDLLDELSQEAFDAGREYQKKVK